jgi:hypothetical protein
VTGDGSAFSFDDFERVSGAGGHAVAVVRFAVPLIVVMTGARRMPIAPHRRPMIPSPGLRPPGPKFTFAHSAGTIIHPDAFAVRVECDMPSSEYHLKQGRVFAGLALAEPDVVRATQLNLLALEHFDKAAKAKARSRWNEGPPKLNRVAIDDTHSRAIVHEIGERLRLFLREEPDIPASLRMKLDRLRDLEL